MASKIRSFFIGLKTRATIVSGLLRFLRQNKMWWMIPMVVLLVIFFIILVFAQSSPLGPFIYTLF